MPNSASQSAERRAKYAPPMPMSAISMSRRDDDEREPMSHAFIAPPRRRMPTSRRHDTRLFMPTLMTL